MQPISAFDLTGKRALVTGSSRGIGLAIAELTAFASWATAKRDPFCA